MDNVHFGVMNNIAIDILACLLIMYACLSAGDILIIGVKLLCHQI